MSGKGFASPRPLAPAPAPSPSTSYSANPFETNNLTQTSSPSTSSHPPVPPSSVAHPQSYSSPSTSTPTPAPKVKKARRSKVAEACRFCRRSHMSCDAGRPCSRCVKRDIAHLCRDEPILWQSPGPTDGAAGGMNATASSSTPVVSSSSLASGSKPRANSITPQALGGMDYGNVRTDASSSGMHSSMGGGMNDVVAQGMMNNMSYAPSVGSYAPQLPMLTANFNLAMLDLASGQDGMGAGLGLDMQMDLGGGEGEFQGLGLSEFLQSLNATSFPQSYSMAPQQLDNTLPINQEELNGALLANVNQEGGAALGRRPSVANGGNSAGPSVPGSPINKTERFLLTAADQKDGSRSDRLARVIHAKFEAGLLRPYNHVAGYTRLMRWMADNMSQSSRQRTLHTLSEFRPAFRAIASGLTDLDLVFIEEAFERLLLDYDRVFSSMGIPSCLWRRTGEIYKGNKEFAALVGVPIEHLQGGKLAIYELMAEESAVNYWEKYGNIAFDAGQKAVLTSCVLINQSVLSKKRKKLGGDKVKMREEAMINCCFSFTIRRDSYAIPSMIVGNFLKY